MASKKGENVLTSEFLAELYNAAITNNQICSAVTRYMEDSFLPDQQYQMLNAALKSYFMEYKTAPQYGIISQRLASSRAVSELLEEIREVAAGTDPDGIRDQFEEYLKLVQFKKIFKEVSKKYEEGARFDAMVSFTQEAQRLQQFSLKPEEFVDIVETHEERLRANKMARESTTDTPVNSWYIDQLDEINRGRNLRTQLSIFLAGSGVGKSHIVRYICYSAAYVSGLDVLHFQLEGSEAETTDAYSAMLSGTSTYEFEMGMINDHTLEHFRKTLDTYKGTLKVRSFPRFGKEVSTMDIMSECERYREKFGKWPSLIAIDSVDLLTDASGKFYDPKNTRFKKQAVAQNLKDLAAITNAWVIGTYQSTVEDREWINTESNYLSSFNAAECKGLVRPCTHFITLNQSDRERREKVLRIYIDKFRFAPKCQPFRIATAYDREFFYDRVRSLNLVNDEK